jgi:hypothetical protein
MAYYLYCHIFDGYTAIVLYTHITGECLTQVQVSVNKAHGHHRFKWIFICRDIDTNPKLWGKRRNCPIARVSELATDAISCLRSLLNIEPGRSLESHVTTMELKRVGLVRRITVTKTTQMCDLFTFCPPESPSCFPSLRKD